MYALPKVAAILVSALCISACEPAPPTSKPPAKQLSQTLSQDIRAGRINEYEQYSRCAGLQSLFAKLGSSNMKNMSAEQRNMFAALAISSALFNGLATAELVKTDPRKPNVASAAKKQSQRNVEAYAATYGLVFFSAQVQSSRGQAVIPKLIESDLLTCSRLIRDKAQITRAS
ncbi:hypothetical protein [uncultured Tateyamaria sp.]|uniref:hypothetical protein n=1 Tax=uncultured Tateyamaria sp. TaxID=455651 RepID=UPI002610C88C|nr:hypothetical protein [uncultured Tateyamaria sp.]